MLYNIFQGCGMAQEFKIECRDYAILIEAKDAAVIDRALEHSTVQGKEGEELTAALLSLAQPGDILSLSRMNAEGQPADGPESQPARQEFSPKTGALLVEMHYQDGILHDAADGTAAVRKFDENTGAALLEAHYRHGLLNDPADGRAAYEECDENGNARVRSHYRNGRLRHERRIDGKNRIIVKNYDDDGALSDTPEGMPAHQVFLADGTLLAVHFAGAGARRNSEDGMPTSVIFNEHSGKIHMALRLKKDGSAKELSPSSLRRLEKKGALQNIKALTP
jgi:hypothetical protein